MYSESLLLYCAVKEVPPSQVIKKALKYWLDGDYRDNSQSVWNFKACRSPLVISMCASWGWEAWVHLTGALQNSFSFISLEPPINKEQKIKTLFEWEVAAENLTRLNLNLSVVVFITLVPAVSSSEFPSLCHIGVSVMLEMALASQVRVTFIKNNNVSLCAAMFLFGKCW